VTAADDAAARDIRPFAFGQVATTPALRLAGIERLGERIARALRVAVEPMARTRTQVSADSIGPVPFSAWLAELPEFTSLSHYRVGAIKGGVLVAVEPALVTRLVDAFYGGSGKPGRAQAREFTPTEQRLLARLTAAASDALVAAWEDVVALDPALIAHETNPAFLSFLRGDEQVVLQSFSVTPGAGAPAAVTVVYPAAGIRPFEPQLAAKVPGGGGEPDTEWQGRLARALDSVRLPVRTVLARPEMRMSELLGLKPGDVIPVNLPPRAPLIVGDRRIGVGTLGDHDGKAALMLEQVFGRGQ